MSARVFADLILLVHFAFVLVAIFGGLAVLYRRWLAWVHLPIVAWATLINLAGWVCPLTPLEIRLRQAAGEAGYAGGFVEHYLLPVLYPALDPMLPAGWQAHLGLIAGLAVLIWNVLVYTLVWWRKWRR